MTDRQLLDTGRQDGGLKTSPSSSLSTGLSPELLEALKINRRREAAEEQLRALVKAVKDYLDQGSRRKLQAALSRAERALA